MTLSVNQNIAFNGNETVQPQQNSVATNPVEKTQTPEKEDKKGLSTGTWIGLGALATAAIAGIAIAATRGRGAQALENAETYAQNLKLANLPEKIEYKPVKTGAEGIEYAKNTFGIKEVDTNFSLEAINDVNRQLVNISNKSKGKFYIPKALR